jgi:hypothetical protein
MDFREWDRYPLEEGGIPRSVVERLHPWLAQMARWTARKVGACVQERWADLRSAQLKQFAKRLMPIRDPIVIVGTRKHKGEYLHPHGTWLSWEVLKLGGGRVKIGPPAEEEVAGAVAEKLGKPAGGVEEFFRVFHGLDEFVCPLDWRRFEDHVGEGELDWQSWGEWKDAAVVFSAPNGDSALLKESGGTAWHRFDEQEVVPIREEFLELVGHYAECLGKGVVFDSYWAEERG